MGNLCKFFPIYATCKTTQSSFRYSLQVKQQHSSKMFYLMWFRHLLLSLNAQSSMMHVSSKFEVHFYLTLMVDMMIIFGWMVNNLFECTFRIDYRFIIVNIYKLFIVVCIIHVLIVLKHRNSSANKKYTICGILKYESSSTYQYPLTVLSLSPFSIPLVSIQCAINDPSTRNHKTLLTTAPFQHVGYIY